MKSTDPARNNPVFANTESTSLRPTNTRPSGTQPSRTQLPSTQPPSSQVIGRRALACLCMGGFLVLLALVLGEHTSSFDDPIRVAFYSLRAEGLTHVLVVITNLANKYFLIAVCLVLLIIPKTRLRFGVPLSAGSLTTVIINSCIKHLVCRERPEILHLVEEHGFSFPSGHSISSMFFYGMAIWLVWHYAASAKAGQLPARAAIANAAESASERSAVGRIPDPRAFQPYEKRTAVVLTVLLMIPLVLVGLTRIYLGVHFPTDVLAGWCLAGFLIVVEVEVIKTIERRHRALPSRR